MKAKKTKRTPSFDKTKRIKETKFAKDLRVTLDAQGLNRIVYSERSFNPYAAISQFKPKIENVKAKTIGVEMQHDWLDEIFADPLKPRTICISGFPSDIRAKCVAAKIFEQACIQYMQMSQKDKRGRSLPKWHRVLGNYHDPIRDAQANRINPSMLIISNVNMDSTNMKLEKVRDLVDSFPDIPRIIVTGGCTPVDFFQHKLYYPLDASIYVGPNNRIGGTSLLDL